ncbi:hypothetical protein MHY_14980 [Megamonas hypermegale ART12/1]|nr:hypothetical protein MHY_14980 [Megamonas hypermegale ART12/1]
MVTGLFICIVGEIMEDIKKQIDELKKKSCIIMIYITIKIIQK